MRFFGIRAFDIIGQPDRKVAAPEAPERGHDLTAIEGSRGSF